MPVFDNPCQQCGKTDPDWFCKPMEECFCNNNACKDLYEEKEELENEVANNKLLLLKIEKDHNNITVTLKDILKRLEILEKNIIN
jgi:hypothetical protein